MKIQISINGQHYNADLSAPLSIAIPLLPNGKQPSHFGAPACTSKTLEGGGFIGDTQRGGSCNVNVLSIIPHCNGTHTESVAHIVDEHMAVYEAIEESIFASVVITIEPQVASRVNDKYIPGFDNNNLVITRSHLENSLVNYSNEQLTGLIIRTMPNNSTKRSTIYNQDNYPVYLTNDAMTYIVERNVKHLLVDFPSVDKMYDEGKLSNHRIFWQVDLDDTQLNKDSARNKTISEMVYINDEIKDGFYLCNLQIPRIDTDAVPSQPELYLLNKI